MLPVCTNHLNRRARPRWLIAALSVLLISACVDENNIAPSTAHVSRADVPVAGPDHQRDAEPPGGAR
ncbi:MAG: hypothetical protein II336_17690 [Loktanella sp.]|nr:hypothetical protein [Loktanella sp.]